MSDNSASIAPNPAAKNWAAFSRMWPDHHKYVIRAERQNNMYLGEQWDEQLKSEIESEGRPALTINEILKTINAVRGHFSKTRVDIGFKPRRLGASSQTAELLTAVTDSVLDANDYAHKESVMFDDGLIEDRGFLDIRVDYQKNVLGEISIDNLDPRQVMIDSDASEYDPDTWNEVVVDRWLSLDDIEANYGAEMRRKVSMVADAHRTYGDLSVRYDTFGGDGLDEHFGTADPDQERRVRSVRVVDRQYKKLARVKEFVDLHTGRTRMVPQHWPEDRIEAAKEAYDLATREVTAKRVRWTVSADQVTMHDDWSPYEEFTIIPYFPIFRRGRPSGLVKHLIDPQDQLNKVESQILHVINTTANSGWMVEAGSLVNMTEEELEERGAETGLVLVYGKNREKPTKIDANQIPTGLEQFAQRSKSHVSDIPGAAALIAQEPNPEMSGVVLDISQSRSLLGLQIVFDNLAYTRKLVGRKIMRLIQANYNEPRLIRRTNWRDPDQPEEEIAVNVKIANQMINDITVGEHDVAVSTAPAQDNYEDAQFARLVELRKAGVMIPDHHVIANTPNLANKKAIADEVKQIQGMGQLSPMQEALQQLQIQKLQLENAEIQAKAMREKAEAAKAQAEAGAIPAKVQMEYQDMLAQHEREVTRIKTDMSKTIANLENKIDLAELHSGAKESLTKYQTQNKRLQQESSQIHDINKMGLEKAMEPRHTDAKPVDRKSKRATSTPKK